MDPTRDLVLKIARDNGYDKVVIREGPHTRDEELPHVTACFRSWKGEGPTKKKDWWTAHLYIETVPQGNARLVLVKQKWWSDYRATYKGKTSLFREYPRDPRDQPVVVCRKPKSYDDL
jgi:hypothetical protein